MQMQLPRESEIPITIPPEDADLWDLIREGVPLTNWPLSAWLAAGFFALLFGLMFLVILHSVIYGHACSKCRRKHALNQTGEKKLGKRKGSGRDCVIYEWKCKYCGNLTWEEQLEETSSSG